MNAAAEETVLVGVGMMTAVGLTAAETAASTRAGIMRIAETSWLDDALEPFPMALVPDDGLPELHAPPAGRPLSPRVSRLLRLATGPVRECLAPLGALRGPIACLLALPELDPRGEIEGRAFLDRLAMQTGLPFDPAGSHAEYRGRAGGLAAIGEAVRRIRASEADLVLVGGVDTYRDFRVLDRLDADHRARSSSNPDSFIPGEGAGFVCLAGLRTARNRRLSPLARISPAASGSEPGHLGSDEPYRGEGLAAAVARLFESAGVAEPVREVYASMNGENHWVKEWGIAFLRNRPAFDPDHGMHHPAEFYGDPGAACGPLLVGLAALGFRDGYRRGPCLVYCSSDGTERAALIASSAPSES